MTTEKDTTNLFQSALIAEKKDNGVTYRLYENRIYHVFIPSNIEVGMELINTSMTF
tara:strand:- start:9744 stop:9911 length:168 start_codon:yes stop_codon:yes gene_type:complete